MEVEKYKENICEYCCPRCPDRDDCDGNKEACRTLHTLYIPDGTCRWVWSEDTKEAEGE